MKVLVTGAAGFVGARLVEVLLEGGYQVKGIDLLDGEDPAGWQMARLEQASQDKRFSFSRVDVTDADAIQRIFANSNPDAVVHLASRRDLGLAEANPADCHRLHVEGALNVMRACHRANVWHLILGSSAHVYGGARQVPFTETDPADRPLSNLGASLRAAELAGHAFTLRSAVNVSVVRMFSVYGPKQAPTRFLPVLMAAADRRVPMPLYGDGTAGRDMIYVDDVVVGLLRVLDRPAPWQVFNLGLGDTMTLGEVAERVSAMADVVLRVSPLPIRPGEMPNTWAATDVLEARTGFLPSVGVQEGIERTMEWYTTRPDSFRA